LILCGGFDHRGRRDGITRGTYHENKNGLWQQFEGRRAICRQERFLKHQVLHIFQLCLHLLKKRVNHSGSEILQILKRPEVSHVVLVEIVSCTRITADKLSQKTGFKKINIFAFGS